jgi:hypothetical protein
MEKQKEDFRIEIGHQYLLKPDSSNEQIMNRISKDGSLYTVGNIVANDVSVLGVLVRSEKTGTVISFSTEDFRLLFDKLNIDTLKNIN